MRTPLVTSFLVLVLLALPARAAELPSAMDFIPTDAQAAVVIPSLQRLDENSAELMSAIELTTIGSIGQMLRVLGPKDSLDMTGSAALVMPVMPHPGAAPPDEPFDAVVIIPTIGFEQFVERIGAQPVDGLHEFAYSGSTFYAAALGGGGGGYIALSGDAALVRAYATIKGMRKNHADELGDAGVRAIAESDVAVIAAGDGIEPVLDLMIQPLMRTAGAIGLLDPRSGSVQQAALEHLKGTLINRTRRSVVALTAGAMGLQINAVARLDGVPVVEPGEKHTKPSPLDLAPDAPFLFAASTRFDHPLIREVLAGVLRGGEPGLHADHEPPARAVLEALSKTDGASLVVYEPTEPLFMVGALSNTIIQWRGDEPKETVAAIRAVIEGLNGQTLGTDRLAVAYAPDSAAIGSMKLGRWSVTGAQINILVFGTQSMPRGYLGAEGTRGYLSIGSDASTLTAAAAMSEEKPSLTDSVYLRQLRRFLLERPAVEWYLNLEPVLKQFAPMLRMAVPGLDIPATLPPVAGAMDIDGDTVRITIFTPAPVLKLTVPMYRALSPSPQSQDSQR